MTAPQTPTPGVPLSAEEQKLPQDGGCVFRNCTFDNGKVAVSPSLESPAPWAVAAEQAALDIYVKTVRDKGPDYEAARIAAAKAIETHAAVAFGVDGCSITTPASGSDGLETFGWVATHNGGAAPEMKGEDRFYRKLPDFGPYVPCWNVTDLVTREAAEKRIGELEARNLEVSVLALRWMEAHDKLKAGQSYDLPSPADAPALQSQVAALKAALVEAHTELVACSEYLDPMIDADGDSEGFHPNREMTLQGGVNRAIERAEQALALKEGR